MVRYEFAVMLRAVGRPQLADTFKHVAKSIIGQGVVLRKLVNLGERQLPYRMKANSTPHPWKVWSPLINDPPLYK